ncbi:restriction endonuclease subunit S [Rhodococcus sp. BGS-1C]|jgi:type I restriction enzyme S subunit|uniref:restriction endonuclease subunit S n=1 Tax=Rhodococcus sp. BGS-1C TaxID=2100132 RepID=UPI003DA00878
MTKLGEKRRSTVVHGGEAGGPDRASSRVKFCADVSLGKTFQGIQKNGTEQLVDYVRAASIQRDGLVLDGQRMWMSSDELRRYDLRTHDVLVVEGGAGYGRSVVLNEDMSGWGFQNHVIRVRPDSGYCGRFLNYCVKAHFASGLIDILIDGATIPALSSEKVRDLPIPETDLATQLAIADYLDREVGDIDAMIGKLGSLSRTLDARKSTLASHVFSMGFDQVKLKWLLDEIDDRCGLRNGHLPLLSVSIHHGVQLRNESTSNQKASEDLSQYKVARIGDIVLNRMRAFQGGLGQTHVDGLVSPDYSVLRPRGQLSSTWAEYVMRSPEFVSTISQRLRGIGSADQSNVRTPRINVRDLLDLSIPLPDRQAQGQITSQLDGVRADTNTMLAKVSELKELLTERRAALITDVVTGRRKVS